MIEYLPAIIGSSGVTALLVAVVSAVMNRRKIKAEATSILTEAAGGIVKILQEDNARLRAAAARSDLRQMRRDRAERERDEKFRQQLHQHHDYDVMLVTKLREAGIQVDNPPRLDFPEYTLDDDDVTESFDPSTE